MGQLVVAAAGAAVGFMVGGPSGAAMGFALGAGLYSLAHPPDAGAGPQLADLKVSGTGYGQAIPWSMGAPRIAPQPWWASDRRPIAHTESVGKGGGGATSTSYTYEVDLLYGLNDGPIQGVTRIWINGKLMYTSLASATDQSRVDSQGTSAWSSLSIYLGTDTQLPDPVYEAAVGVGNAPAFRGRAYMVIQSLQLDSSGAIPNITVELATAMTPVASMTLRNQVTLAANYAPTGSGGVGYAAISAMQPEVRVCRIGSSLVDRYTLDGSYLGLASKAGNEAAWIDPSGAYGVGLLNRGPVTALPPSSFTSPLSAFTSTGLLLNGSVNLLAPLPQAEYYGGFCPCADGDRYLVFTAPTAAAGGGSVVNKWYRCNVASGAPALEASGTLASAIDMYSFPGSALSYLGHAVMLESNLRSMWQAYSAGNVDVDLWTIDDAGVLAKTAGINGLVASGGFPSLFADNGYCVVVNKTGFVGLIRGGDTIQTVTVRGAVEALCGRAGMLAGQFDASALAGITRPLTGFAMGQVGNARGVLEQLQTAFAFDVALSDKLYFVPRGGAAVATVPYTDLGAGTDHAQAQPFALTVASDLELPPQVAVSYANAAADQQTATEYSDRLISGQAAVSTVSLGLALQPADARAIADAIVIDQANALSTATIHLGRAYSAVQPTDVLQVTSAAGDLVRMRIVKRQDSGGVLTLDLVADDARTTIAAGATDTGYTAASTVSALADTVLQGLDLPILRDADDGLGYYVAARGTSTNWPGGVAYASADGGSTYAKAAQVDESACLGVCTTTLGDWTGGAVMDERNTVTVNVGTGQLASVTRDLLLADRTVNAMRIGAEVIRFATATLTGTNPNTYVLGRLLRGQLGTEWASTGHVANEACTLLGLRGLRRVQQTGTATSQALTLKAVTLGGTLGHAVPQAFSNTNIGAKPWAPVNLRSAPQAGGGYLLTWQRRTRLVPTFANGRGTVIPLGEASEAYEVDLLDTGGTRLATLSCSTPAVQAGGPAKLLQYGAALERTAVIGGVLYGIEYDGRGSDSRPRLLRMGADGSLSAATAALPGYVQSVRWDAALAVAYVLTARVSSSIGGPATMVAQRISRIDLATMATTAFLDTLPSYALDDITFDGSTLWSVTAQATSGATTRDLNAHNASTLAIASTTTIACSTSKNLRLSDNGTTGGLLFIAGVDWDKVVGYTTASSSVAWSVDYSTAVGSVYDAIVAGSTLLVVGSAGAQVVSPSTGAVVASYATAPWGWTAAAGYYLYTTRLQSGSAGAVSYSPGTVLLIDASTGAQAGLLAPPLDLLMFVPGAVGSNYLVTCLAGGVYGTWQFGAGLALSGGTAKVYQISAAVGRGYPATINL